MLSDNISINQPNESQANTQESLWLFNMDSPHFIKEEGKEQSDLSAMRRVHTVCIHIWYPSSRVRLVMVLHLKEW